MIGKLVPPFETVHTAGSDYVVERGTVACCIPAHAIGSSPDLVPPPTLPLVQWHCDDHNHSLMKNEDVEMPSDSEHVVCERKN